MPRDAHALQERACVAGFDYTGFYRYFVTMCTERRAPAFLSAEDIDAPVTLLRRISQQEAFDVIAYCFMPDHLHLLVEGRQPRADLRRFVMRYKRHTMWAWKVRSGTHLWQRSYYDHVLREDEDLHGIARYILENPVRAGLCGDPLEYGLLGSLTLNVSDLIASTARYT